MLRAVLVPIPYICATDQFEGPFLQSLLVRVERRASVSSYTEGLSNLKRFHNRAAMSGWGNDYIRLDGALPLPDQERLTQQIPVPVANMMGSASRQNAPSASAERVEELDTWATMSAERANNKRDREDDDYTDETRKTLPAPTSAKRQKQPAAKASVSSPRTKASKANEVSVEGAKARRIDTANRIKAIWGFEFGRWPVYEFIPSKVQKGAQQGRQPQRKAEPQDWNLDLLTEVLHLAQDVAKDQRPRIAQVLRDVIQARVVDTNSDGAMSAQDVQRTYRIMIQDISEAGPSRRSPTLAAANSPEANEGDETLQSHNQAGRRDSPMVGDESARHLQTAQDNEPPFCASNASAFIETLIENLIDTTPEFCGQCIEAIQEVRNEKEQHKAVLLEKARRWRTSFN